MASPASVFITGAHGFIGGTLAARYRSAGADVRGVDFAADPAAGVVAGDISAPGDWQAHAAGCELVINTAAIVSMRPSFRGFWEANVRGTRLALDAAVAGGARRFVQLSSIVTFGFDFEGEVDERDPVVPNGVPYVDTKIASEQVTLAAQTAGEMDCTIIRPGDVYGPRSRPWTILPVEMLRAGRFLLPAGGHGKFTPAYVDNLVDGIVAAAESDAGGGGQIFTLCDGVSIETRDFFGHYTTMLGTRAPRTLPTPVATLLAGAAALGAGLARSETELNANAVRYLARRGSYSIEKARAVLGYEPTVDLDEGMRRTEAWLRETGLV